MQINFHSGLGNQLFQYSYAHYLYFLKNSPISFNFVNTNREDRQFALNKLLGYCSHLFNKNSKILPDSLFESTLAKLLLKIEKNEFSYDEIFSSKLKNYNIIHGYFQNAKYVEIVFHLIKNELEQFLDKIVLPPINFPKKFMGIHVRRGDNIYTLETMGSLSHSYYVNLVEKYNEESLPLLLFTDDLMGAQDVAEKIKYEYILGPSDLNNWQALKLMSQAQILISANSTLSWWAGYLGNKFGFTRKVILPNPWFKNWPVNIGSAFAFDKSTYEHAQFLNKKPFKTNYFL